MSTLAERIDAELVAARKARDQLALATLGVLKSEVVNAGKEPGAAGAWVTTMGCGAGAGGGGGMRLPPSCSSRYSAVILSSELDGTRAPAMPSSLALVRTSLFSIPSFFAMS